MNAAQKPSNRTGLEIAVIGMAGRFPGAPHLDRFWENLKEGIESLSFLSETELAAAGIDPDTIDNPAYIKAAGGILENKACFDAAFFDYTPTESRFLDPQIRVLHECAWEALEDGGYDPYSYGDLIGFYVGASDAFSWEAAALLAGENNSAGIGGLERSLLTNRDFGATRTSYKLNLKGPVVSVQTACSTSLVTVHMACRALLTGECEMALAGGVSISNSGHSGYFYQEGMIISPDGHCRAFAAEARGTIAGEGAGVVLLKRLTAACSDHDRICAVIKASAINNDGNRKPGYTAPSVEGQLQVIGKALHLAALEPDTVTYVETHGTGTPLGDPVEFEALKLAFHSTSKGFCALGSLKTNVGHLNSAAGIGSLIKTILALQHRQIPPSLHFYKPNPRIDFENSPFYVNHRLQDWENKTAPLRAGVSSFGIGGTNAHIILEEAPAISPAPSQQEEEKEALILLSAKTPADLDLRTLDLASHLRKHPNTGLADLAYTLQVGRAAFPHRRSLVSVTVPQTIKKLEAHNRSGSSTGPAGRESSPPPLIFMFPGLGSQYTGMGGELYRKFDFFRREMDRCLALFQSISGRDLKRILYPPDQAYTPPGPDANLLHQPGLAQPSVFILEYALARSLQQLGLQPHAMIGYSLGEYTAACISGVITLEQALELVVRRGQLVEGLPEGAMLGVPLPPDQVQPLLDNRLAIALDNGPSCVVAGPPAAVTDFAQKLKEMKCFSMPVPALRALHTPTMDPILPELERSVQSLTLNKPGIPYISNVTGNWLTAGQAVSPRYWASHIRETVRFGAGLKRLAEIPGAILVEVGPGSDLCALAGRRTDCPAPPKVIDLVPNAHRRQGSYAYFLHKIGKLWTRGLNPHWEQLHDGAPPYRIPLPTYPFNRQRFWIQGDPGTLTSRQQRESHKTAIPPQEEFNRWFYVPQWKRSLLPGGPPPETQTPRRWLLLVDDSPVTVKLVEHLKANPLTRDLVLVRAGNRYTRLGEREYCLQPRQQGDYQSLIQTLAQAGWLPQKIVHLWNIALPPPGELTCQQIEEAHYRGFYSLLFLVRALGRQRRSEEIHLEAVTAHLQEVNGTEVLGPERSPLLGALKVIPQEHPNLRCRCIDIGATGSDAMNPGEIALKLREELLVPPLDPVVALRGPHRWVEIFEPFDLESHAGNPAVLRESGVYLITGGLGAIGLELAHYLARTVSARLILTSRTGLPPRHRWEELESGQDRLDPVVQKIEKIRALETCGGQVMTFSADVSDHRRMKSVIATAEKQWGPISGVIHAAGIIKGDTFQLVQEIGESRCKEQFASKIEGLVVLRDLFRDKPLDFAWIMSSVAAVLGGLKFSAYAAANAFMDHFVHHRNRTRPGNCRWICVDWDGMDTAATEKAFKQIVGLQQLDRLVVSTGGHLHDRLHRWVHLNALHRESPGNDSGLDPDSLRPRPDLINPYQAPGNATETALARIWQAVLGFQRIGVEDDFLELGGDSLKAITVLGKIQKKLEVQLSLKDFLNRPTIREQAQSIHQLDGDGGTPAGTPLAAVEKKEYYALSSAQTRLFILQQMNPGAIAYNQFQVILLEGEYSREKLAEAFRGLMARHEILRTAFFLQGGEPVQAIREPMDFQVDDFDETDGTIDSASVARIIEDFVTPFDLARPPLFRAGLIRFKDHRHLLLLDLHHLVIDGVSFGIFKEEFMALHEGKPLLPLLLQYKDYAEGQGREPGQRALEQHRDYWIREFSAGVPVLSLPYDFPRPRLQSFAGASIAFQLEEKETRELIHFARQQEATPFMLMTAIFAVFLSRLSSQEDIVIGTPTAGRHHPQLESVMGVFLNMLALRSFPSGEREFLSFFQEVRQRILDAFAHDTYPYEELVEQVTLTRDLSRNPLFDVMLDWQGFDFPAVESPGLKMTPFPHRGKIAKYDLTLQAFVTGDRLSCVFEYCTELFKAETLERWVIFFKRTVAAVLENPHRKIAAMDLIPAGEKARILELCNGPRQDFPRGQTLYRLFAEQANRIPGHTAIIGKRDQRFPLEKLREEGPEEGPGTGKKASREQAPGTARESVLTYGQLDRDSRQGARLLRERGLEPGSLVGICARRSLEMMTGIFAILAAGAAYLPLPPSLPPGRRRWLIKESSLKFLLAAAPQDFDELAPAGDLAIIALGDRQKFTPARHDRDIEVTGSADQLAYIIYTSGSTGMPKGVMVEHGSVVNRLHWMQRAYPLGKADRIIQKTPITFDVSVWELFWWFLGGAGLYMLADRAEANPDALLRAIEQNPPATIHFVPSMLSVFLDYIAGNPAAHRLAGLKQLFSSGEALSPTLAEKFHRLTGMENKPRLINLYGPTEATVDVSYYNVPPEKAHGLIPIGKPIDNIALLIVDRYLELQPVGIAGELFIAGAGVARGYLNNPALTGERFCLRRPGGWQPQPIMALRAIPRLTELFPAGDVEEGTFAAESLKMPAGHLKRRAKSQMPGADSSSTNPLNHYPTPLKAKSHELRATLYQTGDLARWLPEGNIEYLGRMDRQIKIRGIRIEPAEIEQRLLDHPAVSAAVVLEQQDLRDNYLCAYIARREETEVQELKAYLSEFLPEAMIPAVFVGIERIPLKPNGKLDREALVSEGVRLDSASAYTPPDNPIEQAVALLWAEVLNIEKIGVEEIFFNIGGNSLKLIRLFGRLKEVYPDTVEIQDLFDYPTIRGLAQRIAGKIQPPALPGREQRRKVEF